MGGRDHARIDANLREPGFDKPGFFTAIAAVSAGLEGEQLALIRRSR
jgi:hypothetical protein